MWLRYMEEIKVMFLMFLRERERQRDRERDRETERHAWCERESVSKRKNSTIVYMYTNSINLYICILSMIVATLLAWSLLSVNVCAGL